MARPPIGWRLATVRSLIDETRAPRRSCSTPPGGRGTPPASTSTSGSPPSTAIRPSALYSIASALGGLKLALTVERIDDGEVTPYLTEELRAGDELELRGPIGGPFTWRCSDGGPLLLIACGSGVVPLMRCSATAPRARHADVFDREEDC